MEAGEYGLTRVTCSSHAVSSWIRSPGCCGFRGVFLGGGADFSVFFLFDFFSFFERTRPHACRPPASMRPPLASFTSLLVMIMRQGRGGEATEAVLGI